jgi:hypothetical protein
MNDAGLCDTCVLTYGAERDVHTRRQRTCCEAGFVAGRPVVWGGGGGGVPGLSAIHASFSYEMTKMSDQL